jgi:hypothetical protein
MVSLYKCILGFMSYSSIHLSGESGICKVLDGFQMRAMQVKESNDPFMFGAIIDSGIWIFLYD